MYRVKQTKGIPFAFSAICHTNIRTLEEAIELAKKVEAKTVDKYCGMCYGQEVWVAVWHNK